MCTYTSNQWQLIKWHMSVAFVGNTLIGYLGPPPLSLPSTPILLSHPLTSKPPTFSFEMERPARSPSSETSILSSETRPLPGRGSPRASGSPPLLTLPGSRIIPMPPSPPNGGLALEREAGWSSAWFLNFSIRSISLLPGPRAITTMHITTHGAEMVWDMRQPTSCYLFLLVWFVLSVLLNIQFS